MNDGAAAACSERSSRPRRWSRRIKVDGRRLHDLAREGVEVEREPADDHDRRVRHWRRARAPSEWTFDVTCSVGTYVRVLLSDLASASGTIGHLSALRRLASGTHDVEDALTLEELERRRGSTEAPSLHPPRDLRRSRSETPSWTLTKRNDFVMGQRVHA